MMALELAQLRQVMPHAPEIFVAPLNAALERFEISTPSRVAAFLAQAAHESAELRTLRENLNYSADALVRLWPHRFTPADASSYARQPERIANRVYCDRMGNGPEASGDGWRFRGGGIFQLTGRGAYRETSIALFGDLRLVDEPDRITDPAIACDSAGHFWSSRGLNELADAGDFEAITRRINGGMNGYVDRVAYLARAGSLA